MSKLNGTWLAAMVVLGLCLVAVGCNSAPPDESAAGAAAMAKADEAWAAAAASKSADAWVAYYSDDVIVLAPNAKRIDGKADARKMIDGLFQMPDVQISWKANKVEVAKSGDIGYIVAAYQMSWTDAKMGKMNEVGKATEVWRKQADGSWKCIVDQWSPDDMPPAPAAPEKKK